MIRNTEDNIIKYIIKPFEETIKMELSLTYLSALYVNSKGSSKSSDEQVMISTNEWTSESKPMNKFVGKDWTVATIKAKNCYAVKRNQAAPSSLNIKVVADKIKICLQLSKKRKLDYKKNVQRILGFNSKTHLLFLLFLINLY